MDFSIGLKFVHEGAEYEIVSIVYNRLQKVVKFNAITYNNSYYESKTFTVLENEQRSRT